MVQRGRKGTLQLTAVASEIERRWLAHERAFEAELETLRAAHGELAVSRALALLRQRNAAEAAA